MVFGFAGTLSSGLGTSDIRLSWSFDLAAWCSIVSDVRFLEFLSGNFKELDTRVGEKSRITACICVGLTFKRFLRYVMESHMGPPGSDSI